MAQSITGFGRSEAYFDEIKLCIDIKSLNSKSCDLNVKLPLKYKEKEFEIRKKIADQLFRGKIDCFFNLENLSNTTSIFNRELIQNYINELKSISPTASDVECLQIAIKLPEALGQSHKSLDEKEWEFVSQQLDEALSEINKHRSVEGQVLKNELIANVNSIMSLLNLVHNHEQERIETIKSKYKNALSDFENIDEQRYYQEIVYYIEKLDISEEKVRLQQHCDYFIEVINNEDNTGRKLAFISQEMGREINTLGSKANHSQLQKIVVNMKEILEKIKEQLLNVL